MIIYFLQDLGDENRDKRSSDSTLYYKKMDGCTQKGKLYHVQKQVRSSYRHWMRSTLFRMVDLWFKTDMQSIIIAYAGMNEK